MMFQSFYEMFGKWTQVQTYSEVDKSTNMTEYRDPLSVGTGARP